MVPLAGGLVIGATSSIKLVGRFGTTKIVIAGLFGLGSVLVSALTWTYDMPYWPLGLCNCACLSGWLSNASQLRGSGWSAARSRAAWSGRPNCDPRGV
jgi:hypothetical protein